jgi:hypothetical protein
MMSKVYGCVSFVMGTVWHAPPPFSMPGQEAEIETETRPRPAAKNCVKPKSGAVIPPALTRLLNGSRTRLRPGPVHHRSHEAGSRLDRSGRPLSRLLPNFASKGEDALVGDGCSDSTNLAHSAGLPHTPTEAGASSQISN